MGIILDYLNHILLLGFIIVLILSFSFRRNLGTLIIQAVCIFGVVYNFSVIIGPILLRIGE